MKTALGEAFEAEPKTLSVVNEEFERGAGAFAKDEERAGERVLIERAFAKREERINALAEINGSASKRNPELWDKLNNGVSGA